MSKIAKTMKKEIEDQITFEDKVRSMTAKEIIMAMVDGLMNPTTRINMSTFGENKTIKFLGIKLYSICYGCAATNTICRIIGKSFDSNNINDLENRSEMINSGKSFLRQFEMAIDDLRVGCINSYNIRAKESKFAQIKFDPDLNLPGLLTESYKQNLHHYIDLANYQED